MTMLRRRGAESRRRTNTFLDFPAGGTNVAYILSHAGLDITGDMGIRFAVAFDDTTPAAHQCIVSKYWGSAPITGWEVRLETDGRMDFLRSGGGTTAYYLNGAMSILPFAQAGVPLLYAINFDLINGVWSTVNMYYKPFNPMSYYADLVSDGGWTFFGNDSDANQAATVVNTQGLCLGRRPSGAQPLSGDLYAVRVTNGLGGPAAFDVDFGRITKKGVRDPADATVKDSISGQTIQYITSVNPAWDWGEAAA